MILYFIKLPYIIIIQILNMIKLIKKPIINIIYLKIITLKSKSEVKL